MTEINETSFEILFLHENQKQMQLSDWYIQDDRMPIQYVVPFQQRQEEFQKTMRSLFYLTPR